MRDFRWNENKILDNLTKESSGDNLFDEEVVATWQKFRPKPDDFADVYDNAGIAADNRYVEEREKEFEKETKEATRLYYSTMDSIETYNWFGQDCMVIPASRYDDIKNGIDFILCFTQEDSPSIKIGIDITVSEDKKELSDKLKSSSEKLSHGKLPHVKYFQSDQEAEPKGQIELPRLVIGANKENTNLLFKDVKSVLEKKEKGKLIEQSDIQHAFLQEMRAQLVYLVEVATETLVQHNKLSHEKVIDLFADHLRKVGPIKVGDQIGSEELNQLLNDLEENREALSAIDKQATENILVHLRAFQIIDDLVKEKGSDKIPFGADDSTIDFLKRPKVAA